MISRSMALFPIIQSAKCGSDFFEWRFLAFFDKSMQDDDNIADWYGKENAHAISSQNPHLPDGRTH